MRVRRTGVDLPEEIIMEILALVPAKTLGLCKCVSKQWRNLISDPKLIKTHASLNNRRRAKALLIDRGSFFVGANPRLEDKGSFFVVDFDSEAGIADGRGKVFATPLKVKPQPPPKHSSPDWDKVYCSYNGLVLFLDTNLRFFILNPTTLECKKLRKPPVKISAFRNVKFGFGYDFTTDDYKAVVISWPKLVYVYSFKSNAWKRVQNSPFGNRKAPLYIEEGVFLNGFLHWFGEASTWQMSNSNTTLITAFDMAEETFRVVPLPSEFGGHSDRMNSFLGVVGGSLCIIWQQTGNHVNGRVDVWIMNEYGLEESWTKISFYQDIAKFNGVFFLGNDEFMLILGKERAVIYNVKEQSSTHVDFPGFLGRLCCTFSDSLVSYKQLC